MRVGVPSEIKKNEHRVGLTPTAVREYVAHGHAVSVQTGAGLGAGFTDADYKKAGAKIVATGRSDFPNQVNNSLGFPGIFRGTLDVKARTISDTMCLAAVLEIAKTAEDNGLREDYIVPTMDDWEVFPREAAAVGTAAVNEGLAREKKIRKELYELASVIIKRARDQTKYLMKGGYILPPPKA